MTSLVADLKYSDTFSIFDSKHWDISKNVAKSIASSAGAAYGNKVVESGVHEWLIKYENTGSICCSGIGISTSTDKTTGWFDSAPYSYTLFQNSSNVIHKRSNEKGSVSKNEKIKGAQLASGSTVRICLNLDGKTVTFYLNDKEIFCFKNIKEGKYRVCVNDDKATYKYTILESSGSLPEIGLSKLPSELDSILKSVKKATVNVTDPFLISNCQNAFCSTELADVTFIVGKNKNKKRFPAVRLWFAIHSGYFKDLFVIKKNNEATVIEQDITPLAFEYIYKYFYLQQPIITANNVVDILYAADKYKLNELVLKCNNFMNSTTDIGNILLFESRAIFLELNVDHPVRQRFIKWLTVETSKQIIESKIYLKSSQELIIYLIQSNSFSVQEQDVWILCKTWCDHQMGLKKGSIIINEECKSEGIIVNETVQVRTTLKQWMSPFIQYIRFTLMKNEYFVQHIYPLDILEMEHSMNITLSIMDPSREINQKYIRNIKERNKVIYYHKLKYKICNKKTKALQYKLSISNPYPLKVIGNTYQALTNNDIMQGCVVRGNGDEKSDGFIMASFDKKKYITRMDIGASGNIGGHGWNADNLNDRKIQWKNDSNNWIDWQILKDFKNDGQIETIYDMNIHTTSIRISNNSNKILSIGCWRLYGYDDD